MGKCKNIMITSCKGGVGKSTVAANIALSLAHLGKSVVIFDCDFGMRCLDLIMGHEPIYDLADVCTGRIKLEKAAIKDIRASSLYIVASPCDNVSSVNINTVSMAKIIEEAVKIFKPDYIIFDTPGDMGISFKLAAQNSDFAVVVTNHQPTSIRAAERTAMTLSTYPKIETVKLIINRFDIANLRSFVGGQRSGIVEIIDSAAVQLLGVVPYDYRIEREQESGNMVDFIGGESERAFINIAKRIDGESIPLFDGFKGAKKIRHLF